LLEFERFKIEKESEKELRESEGKNYDSLFQKGVTIVVIYNLLLAL
jgi:hypothetical protein